MSDSSRSSRHGDDARGGGRRRHTEAWRVSGTRTRLLLSPPLSDTYTYTAVHVDDVEFLAVDLVRKIIV